MPYLLILAHVIFWGVTLTVKYLSLGYFDWDLAFFNQAMWNLLGANTASSLFNINFFGNHINFIAFIFLPLYALFPNALFLIYLKVILMPLAAIPLFLIARDNLNYKYGLFFVLLYLLYPGLNYALAYEFDWENLAVFFMMWLFYFYYKKKFREFCATGLILLVIKENMSFALFMLGIYALLQQRSKKWFLSGIIPGIAWFYACVFLLAPYFARFSRHIYWGNYPVLAGGPLAAIGLLFSKINREFLFQLFSPVLFVSFLSPGLLCLGLPFFLQHMLSRQYAEHTVYFGYVPSLMPFIFISAVFGVKFLIKHTRRLRFFTPFFAFSAIACTIILSLELLPLFDSIFSNAKHELNPARKDLLRLVPKDSPVIATFAFLPRLSGRRRLYAFEDIYYNLHYDTKRPLPEDIEYALVDFNDFYLADRLRQIPSGYEKIADFFRRRDFKAASAIGDIVLFKRGPAPEFRLFDEKRGTDFSGKKIIRVGGGIEFTFDPLSLAVSPGKILPIKFYWHCLERNPAVNYEIKLSLIDAGGRSVYSAPHPIGYRIKPTSSWKEGDFLEENYNFFVPPLPKGRYVLKAEFFNYETAAENNTVVMGAIDIDA